MKFSKELNKNIQKYKNDIPKEYWFNYKLFKKKLNAIVLKHYLIIHQRNLSRIQDIPNILNISNISNISNIPNISNISNISNIPNISNKNTSILQDECCICLESKNLMKTFCCHNFIHHHCLVHTFAYSNENCPLCRAPIQDSIRFNPTNLEESLDAEILSLISSVHLEMIKFYYVYNNQLIYRLSRKQNIIKTFYQINITAVTKICKKIDKHLHINIKPYFLDIVEKNKKTLIFKYEDNNCSFCTIV